MSVDTHANHERDEALADFGDLSLIRRGRRATVYRARELPTNRWVALKVLDVAAPSEAALEAFAREASVLAALGGHPNIVTMYRHFTLADGRPALVLELCHGSIADNRPAGQPLPAQDVVRIGIKIAGALDTAHRAGVLHRNVTPDNILTTIFDEPALTDFGIATLHTVPEEAAPLLDFATVHTAPELLDGRTASPVTDVYELGSTLYELVNGTPAFRAYDRESPAALSLRILYDPAPRIDAPHVPLELSDVLLWAMTKDPANRPPSAAWLASELARIATNQGWPRTPLVVREPRRRITGVRRRLHRASHRRSSGEAAPPLA
jgi:serine/threonine-protein kinase PknK